MISVLLRFQRTIKRIALLEGMLADFLAIFNTTDGAKIHKILQCFTGLDEIFLMSSPLSQHFMSFYMKFRRTNL